MLELALGTRSRSGQQYDIWEAVYSPVGADGYPQRIFNKETVAIHPRVADHWREHYDIGHILTRDWATLGPKLRGKLWLNTGDMDTFFLERSVRLVEARLAGLSPAPAVPVAYGHGHRPPSGKLYHSKEVAPLNLESPDILFKIKPMLQVAVR